MKKTFLLFTSLLFILTSLVAASNFKAVAKFADLKKAKALLSAEDIYTDHWSQFDIDSRMGKPNSTKADLLKMIVDQAQAWTKNEEKLLNGIITEIDQQIKDQGLHIEFPAEIYFVKTTVKEEGGALGYTRNNFIVLKDDILSFEKEELKGIVIHELFHVLSRNDQEFRKAMYGLIGFQIIEDIPYPAEIKDSRITNPDTPLNDCYISINHNGNKVNAMMILYADKPYTTGVFFEYLRVGFLVLKDMDKKEFLYVNNKPVILGLKDVTNFNEQIGSNTGYVIHAEEVMAENFVFAINNKTGLPSQWLVENIQKKLKK